MALEIKLSQKMSQQLLMTPQLQQAIKLLQLGRQEYLEAIQQELLENPILEEIKDEDSRAKTSEQKNSKTDNSADEIEEAPQSAPDRGPIDWEDYLAHFNDSRGAATPKNFVDHEDRPSLEATLTRDCTLAEHLIAQLRMQELSNGEQRIAFYIIGNIDKRGYLQTTDEEICEACDCQIDAVQQIVQLVQSLEPAGVGARTLQECLLIQLDALGLSDNLAARILREHLDKLEKRRYEQIAKAEKIPVEKVYDAVMIIQKLEPWPGRPFVDDPTRYIVPDIYIYKDKREYVISLNEDGLPKLKVSPYYLELLQRNGDDSAPSREYLTERLKAASWLIKSIHQRQRTIYKVAESIVKFQREFFDHGIEHLRPLVLKDVADDIGMHESTVSRVTSNKYAHTPQGVFELKFFFTTGIQTADGNLSSSSIKEKIRNIIAAESPEAPISDQGIVELLEADKIKIARRTVAKYRENLGIASSAKRKKLF